MAVVYPSEDSLLLVVGNVRGDAGEAMSALTVGAFEINAPLHDRFERLKNCFDNVMKYCTFPFFECLALGIILTNT